MQSWPPDLRHAGARRYRAPVWPALGNNPDVYFVIPAKAGTEGERPACRLRPQACAGLVRKAMSSTESLAAARRNQIPRGIAYMVASTALFAAINAIVKLELAIYPVGEVAFYRALFALITVSVMIIPKTGIAVFRTHRYFGHLQRGVSQFGSMICMFFAFSMMSLGSAVALSFAAPLFTTLLSIMVLKEKVGVHRWSALVVGV